MFRLEARPSVTLEDSIQLLEQVPSGMTTQSVAWGQQVSDISLV
jgi:hypothetical protein